MLIQETRIGTQGTGLRAVVGDRTKAGRRKEYSSEVSTSLARHRDYYIKPAPRKATLTTNHEYGMAHIPAGVDKCFKCLLCSVSVGILELLVGTIVIDWNTGADA